MSNNSRKRKASQLEMSDKFITASSPTSSNLDDKHPQLSVSASCSGKFGVRTKLQFEFDANVEFKAVYAICVLSEDQFVHVDTKIANIYYASIILNEAREALNNHLVTESIINALHNMIETVKNEEELEQEMRQRLKVLQTGPGSHLNDIVLESWYAETSTFLKHAEALSDKFDIEDDLRNAHQATFEIYQESSKTVEDQSLIIETDSEISDITGREYAVGPSILHRHLSAMCQDENPCADSIRKRFLGVFHAYECLYALVIENESTKFRKFPLSEFASAFGTIRREMLELLRYSNTEQSLRDQFLERAYAGELLCAGFSHALVSRLGIPLRDLLGKKLEELRASTKEQPSIQLEHEFTTLASMVSDFAFTTPAEVSEKKWIYYVPQMLTQTQVQCFMNKLQCLHAKMQLDAYNNKELPRLWFNIWTGLKSTYLMINEYSIRLESRGFPLEARFFYRPTVQNQFELILSGPEALRPEIIENMVGEYCIFVAECQRSQTAEYGILRQLKASVVKEPIFELIQHFSKMREWNDLAIRGIEKCAIRLNHLTGGPAFVRRQIRKPTPTQREVQKWTFDRVCLDIERTSSKSSPLRSANQFGMSIRSNSLSLESMFSPASFMSSEHIVSPRLTTNPFDRQQVQQTSSRATDDCNNHNANPPGIDVVSAFDYVMYPFAETRAIEVAQSRQISREMSQSGIYSDGALSEDVVNLPPRHTWPPGTISPWVKPLAIDPISIIRDTWSFWRHGSSNRRQLRQPKPFPALTPRKSRRERAGQHPRPGSLLDVKSKITKPAIRCKQIQLKTDSPRTLQHIHVPKLRGGGSFEPGDNQSQNPATQPVNVQLSPSAMDTATHQLIDRMQGYWGSRPMPSTAHIREYFLAPNNWDVDAAHDAARRFLNYGLANLNTTTTDHPGHDNQASDTSNTQSFQPYDPDDPYVSPTAGLDPRVFGMPIGQGPIIPGGRRGPRLPPTSPTPSSRRGGAVSSQGLSLDQPLPAHWVAPNDGGLGANATSGQNAFTSTGLPFTIYEDPHSDNGGNHSPLPSNSSPAPNRQQIRSTSPNPDGNNSHQPNIRSSSSPNTGLVLATIESGCGGNLCHPCPRYSGLFHHVCQAQVLSGPSHGYLERASGSDGMGNGGISLSPSGSHVQPEGNPSNNGTSSPPTDTNAAAASSPPTLSGGDDLHGRQASNQQHANNNVGLDDVEQAAVSALANMRNQPTSPQTNVRSSPPSNLPNTITNPPAGTSSNSANQPSNSNDDDNDHANGHLGSSPDSDSGSNANPGSGSDSSHSDDDAHQPGNTTRAGRNNRATRAPRTTRARTPAQRPRRGRLTVRASATPAPASAPTGSRGGRVTRSATAAARAASAALGDSSSSDSDSDAATHANTQRPAARGRGRGRGRPSLTGRTTARRGRGRGSS